MNCASPRKAIQKIFDNPLILNTFELIKPFR